MASSSLDYSKTILQPRQRLLYKTAPDGCECHLDVYLPSGPPPTAGFPGMVTIHAGGFFAGECDSNLSPGQTNYLLDHGMVVISINYRLVPQVTFPEVMEDVLDAWKFVHEELPTRVEHVLNPNSVAVMGFSAGAMAAVTLGLFAQRDIAIPRPKCLVPFYGASHWPDLPEGYIKERDELMKRHFSEDDWEKIEAFFKEPAISHLSYMDAFSNPSPQDGPRKKWLAKAVMDESVPEVARSYCLPLPNSEIATWSVINNANSSFPPTCIVIPTKDTIVNPTEMFAFYDKLKGLGVDVIKFEVEADHEFDGYPRGQFGGDWWKEAVEPALDWAIEKSNA